VTITIILASNTTAITVTPNSTRSFNRIFTKKEVSTRRLSYSMGKQWSKK